MKKAKGREEENKQWRKLKIEQRKEGRKEGSGAGRKELKTEMVCERQSKKEFKNLVCFVALSRRRKKNPSRTHM